MENEINIMHGVNEVAGQAYYSVLGLRENNHNADLVLWSKSPFEYPVDKCLDLDFNAKYKYPINAIKTLTNYHTCVNKYDVFHFHAGHSLLPKNLDLRYLKRRNKRLVFEFHGTDIRQRDKAKLINPLIEQIDFADERYITDRANDIYQYADAIIVHDDELIPYIDRKDLIYVVPLRINVDRFKPSYPDPSSKEITIVHAPSNRKNKGTAYILEAIEQMKKKYNNINFVMLENMPQKKAIEYYETADIILDQVICGFYGVLSLEAMALGKPVITYVTDYLKERLPKELPIVSASPETIVNKLDNLISDGEMRNSIGIESRQYVEKYHDCKKNSQLLWDVYNGNAQHLTGRDAFAAVANKR